MLNCAAVDVGNHQVPQFILDECYRRNERCSLVCTQPRRIAAASVARRYGRDCWEGEGGLAVLVVQDE